MKRRSTALALVVGLVAASTMAMVGTAAAGAVNTSIAYVNGTSADPTSVTVDGAVVAEALAFAETVDTGVQEAGSRSVAFGDGSALDFEAAGGVAYTVVSGAGSDGQTAGDYPIALEPIEAGKARVNVWNAATEAVEISIDGEPATTQPGLNRGLVTVDAGTTVTIEVGGVSTDITPDEDNNIEVFAVNDGTNWGIAQSVTASMSDLIAALSEAIVPDVAGLSAEDATNTLVVAGFDVGQQDESNAEVEAGLVIRSEPAAGAEVTLGDTIVIFVSTGPGNVAVPDVVGTPQADAESALADAGLASSVVEEASNDVDEGLVISQNPNAGIEVAAGTEVVLTVSTGPGDVAVPDFVGMTVEEANAAAEELGLEPVFVEDAENPDPDGLVVEQEPEPGTIVPSGSQVTLQLSPATEDAWTSIKIDPDRLLTAAGLNFLPESTSEISVLGTEKISRQVVDDSGFWLIEMDIASLDPLLSYELLVTGTAEDGSDYEQIFNIPPAGEEPDELVPVDDGGISPWVWIIGTLILVALVALVILLVQQMRGESDGGGNDDDPADDGSASGTDTDS